MRLGTPRRRSCARLCRGGAVLLSFVGYLAAVVGYPMPGVARKVSQRPFPCQHHACGCVDADQCWRGCCCFTPRQKLAWARTHHVTPPADAERESDESQLLAHEHEHGDDRDHLACEQHSARCDRAAGEQLASDEAAGRAASAENHEGGRAAHRCCPPHGQSAGGGAAESPEAAGPVRFVSGDAWRKCRGLPTQWVSTGAAVPPPRAMTWQFSWDVVEWLSTSAPALYGGCLSPPVPPPRV